MAWGCAPYEQRLNSIIKHMQRRGVFGVSVVVCAHVFDLDRDVMNASRLIRHNAMLLKSSRNKLFKSMANFALQDATRPANLP